MTLEKMDDFFTARVEGYDEHMLRDVGGCRNGYRIMADETAKISPSRILDLGCGTGLELDEIFARCPDVHVKGIDMTAAMLEKLCEKHPEKKLELILGDYFEEPFGKDFDAAVSFQSLHHFTPAKKLGLYEKLFAALRSGGVFLLGDYMCETDEQQEWFRSEYEKLKSGQNLGDGMFHFDTPLAEKNEISLLEKAGFTDVRIVFKEEHTVIISAKKPE